jgi:signal transduction histidine kinase
MTETSDSPNQDDLVKRISELEKALVEEQKKNERMGVLISTVSHELIGSVGRIMGFSELLLMDGNLEGESLSHTQVIFKSSMDVYEYIKDTLSNARRNNYGINTEPLKPYKIIETVSDMYAPRMLEKEISILNAVKEEAIVSADRVGLESVVRNYFSNAVKYTPKEGNIFVVMTPYNEDPENKYMLSVINSGERIPEEKIDSIFLPHGASEKGTNNETGNHVGLSLCKKIAEDMGCEVGVKNTVSGVKFYIILPKYTENKTV